jgi:hypothetical protein
MPQQFQLAKDALGVAASVLGLGERDRELVGVDARVEGPADGPAGSAVSSAVRLFSGLWGSGAGGRGGGEDGGGDGGAVSAVSVSEGSLGQAFVRFLLAESEGLREEDGARDVEEEG